MAGSLGAFVLVAVVMICTPGPDTALTIRNAAGAGRRAGLATAAGVASGQAVWVLASAVGAAALLRASAPAFEALRWIGAAYLVYLGVQSLRAAFGRRAAGHAAAPAPGAGSRRAFRQGLLSNLANPKMGVFFVTLLPQFASSAAAVLALGLLFAAMTLAWLALYALVVARLGDLLRAGTRARRALDAVTGAVLVGLGARLASDR